MKPYAYTGSTQVNVIAGRRGRMARLICGGPSVQDGLGCGTASRFVPITSPAAPDVSVAEALRPLGWTNDAGTFSSMALGLSALCPMCSKLARQIAQ